MIRIDPRKLQHEYKHAADFGIIGNWDIANAQRFERALQDHVVAPSVQIISGTYRGTIGVTHHFEQATGRNVMVDETGCLVAAWRLSASQVSWLLRTGNVQ